MVIKLLFFGSVICFYVVSTNELECTKTFQKVRSNLTKVNLLVPCRHASKIEMLDLSENYLTEIPAHLLLILTGNLREIDLGHNLISKITETDFNMSSVQNVTRLQLQYNKIDTISGNAFKSLINLEYISLSFNNIERISYGTFTHAPYLRQLYLESNRIFSIERGAILKNSKLALFKLDLNRVSDEALVNVSFSETMPYIESVYLSHNELLSIDAGMFFNTTEIIQINMDNNQIVSIAAGSFNRLLKLQTLNLSQNRLQDLGDELFDNLVQLRSLHLNNNNLKYFNINRNENVKETLDLYVDNNPWQCVFLFNLFLKPKIRIIFTNNTSTTNVKGIPCTESDNFNLTTFGINGTQSEENKVKTRKSEEFIYLWIVLGITLLIAVISASIVIYYFCCSAKPKPYEYVTRNQILANRGTTVVEDYLQPRIFFNELGEIRSIYLDQNFQFRDHIYEEITNDFRRKPCLK